MLSRIAEKSGEGLATFLFASTAFFCGLFFTMGPGVLHDFSALWALGILFVAWVLAAFGLEAESSCGSPQRAEYLLPLFFFLGSLGLGLYHLEAFCLWGDEQLQATCVEGPRSITSAASFTQMPLSYYFTALGIHWFGKQELGQRIFPCLFVAGSAALFSRTVGMFTKNRPVRFFGPLAYILNPWVIRYAQEGRPYGCALFCAVLWLLHVRSLATKAGSIRAPAFHLAASTLLLGLSIAFQSLLLILSLTALMALAVAFAPKLRVRAALILATQLGSVAALMPLVRGTMDNSRPFLRAAPTLARLKFDAGLFAAHAQALLFFWLPAYFILFLPLVFYWRAPRKTAAPSLAPAALYAGILITFVTSFWVAFSVLVYWDLHPRYYIVAVPLSLLLLLDLFSTALSVTQGSSLRWGLCVFFFSALCVPELAELPNVYNGTKFEHSGPDTRSLFRLLHEKGKRGDLAFSLPYQDPSLYEFIGFVAASAYYEAPQDVFLTDANHRSGALSNAELVEREFRANKPASIFLAFFPEPPALEGLFHNPALLGPKDSLFSGHLYVLFQLDAGLDWEKSLDRFLARLVGHAKPGNLAYGIYDTLMRLAEHRHDRKACAHWLGEMKAFKDSSERTQKIWKFHEARCQAGTKK